MNKIKFFFILSFKVKNKILSYKNKYKLSNIFSFNTINSKAKE